MKKILLITSLLSIVCSAGAQQSGRIVYEETMKITFDLPDEFAGMIPNESKNKMQLLFTSEESIYKAIPREEHVGEEIESNHGGVFIKIEMSSPDNETYRNLKEGVIIEKQNLFGRYFRITGEPEKIKWKMTGDKKQIAGYLCMKATYMRDTIPVTAWFTPQIPIQNGPGIIGQLPGLILELDVDNGQMVTRALSVELRPLSQDEEILKPTKGKEISREKFEIIRKEKTEEMKEMGRGKMIIMRH